MESRLYHILCAKSAACMKTKSDPRHQKRIKIVKDLFTWDFDKKQLSAEIVDIVKNIKVVDSRIQKSAPNRPIGEINKLDLAILRLSIFELIISKDAPEKVIVDEAVEISKEYGGDSGASFVNGVLGAVIKNAR